MHFGLLYEIQLPRPWDERAGHRMIHEAPAEVETADRHGFDGLWANKHRLREEHLHSSALRGAAVMTTPDWPPGTAMARRRRSRRVAGCSRMRDAPGLRG